MALVDTNAAFSSSLIVETEKGKTNVEVGDDKIVERIVNVDSDTSLDDLRDMMLTDEESEEEMREGSALEEDVSMTQDDSIFTEEPTDTDEEYIEDEDEVWNGKWRTFFISKYYFMVFRSTTKTSQEANAHDFG